MRRGHVAAFLSLNLLLGCTSDKDETEPTEPAEDTASWWETDVEDSAEEDTRQEKPDDTGFDLDLEDCPDDFDPTEPCEGDWTSTLCIEDGQKGPLAEEQHALPTVLADPD